MLTYYILSYAYERASVRSAKSDAEVGLINNKGIPFEILYRWS